MKVSAPSVSDLVIPITVGSSSFLFLLQRLGTGGRRLFGPVMAFWFFVSARSASAASSTHPAVLKALSPTYAVGVLGRPSGDGVLLARRRCPRGDGRGGALRRHGPFRPPPITRAWLVIVFPACILNYMGQGALDPRGPGDAISSPFFLLAPGWAQLPLVFLAAAATVIASQAVITGAFSLSARPSQLGYLPRLRIVHTSAEQIGQIYVPGSTGR